MTEAEIDAALAPARAVLDRVAVNGRTDDAIYFAWQLEELSAAAQRLRDRVT